ncbi:MAG: hypothetical protein J3Q66DRAFT_400198 [Benniella sp.]|nr:MAG: hypothetical protein J3Q66DRAFT_400198 [Benniella sp.]
MSTSSGSCITIIAHRLKQARNLGFQKKQGFFDKRSRTLAMRAAGPRTYVALCKTYNVYNLLLGTLADSAAGVFRTLEMRAARPRTYVALCKMYKIYNLPPTQDDFTQQFQSLAHLLQVRTPGSFNRRPTEKELRLLQLYRDSVRMNAAPPPPPDPPRPPRDFRRKSWVVSRSLKKAERLLRRLARNPQRPQRQELEMTRIQLAVAVGQLDLNEQQQQQEQPHQQQEQ